MQIQIFHELVITCLAGRPAKKVPKVPKRQQVFCTFADVKLNHLRLDYHKLFIVNLLHEFELGVWKAIFTHILQILHAIGGDTVQDLNRQY